MNLCTLVFKSTSKLLNERTMIFHWTEANMVSGNVNMHPNCTVQIENTTKFKLLS